MPAATRSRHSASKATGSRSKTCSRRAASSPPASAFMTTSPTSSTRAEPGSFRDSASGSTGWKRFRARLARSGLPTPTRRTSCRRPATPVTNPSATPVPFAFTFGPGGRLVAGEAGASSVTTYQIGQDGTLADPKSQTDGQVALCWIERVGRFYFVSNTGSSTLSAFRVGGDGQPELVNAVAANTNPGPIDLASSGDFLYAETGLTSTVDEFRVDHDGTLSPIGSVTGLPPGIEGIASK